MLSDEQKSYLATAVKPMQIVLVALALGVIVFLVAVVVLTDKPAEDPFLTYVGLAFGVIAFLAWLIVPNALASNARRTIAAGQNPSWAQGVSQQAAGDVGQLAGVYQIRLIVASALLEGAAFFNLVAYLIEAHQLSLVAAVVLVVIMLCQFPTYNRLADWVSHELENVDQLRA